MFVAFVVVEIRVLFALPPCFLPGFAISAGVSAKGISATDLVRNYVLCNDFHHGQQALAINLASR